MNEERSDGNLASRSYGCSARDLSQGGGFRPRQRRFHLLLLLKFLLPSNRLMALHRPQSPFLKHRFVFFPAIAGRRQHLLAGEDGVGASHEAHHLLLLAHRVSASSKADDGSRHDQPRGTDSAQNSVEGDGLAFAERCAFDGH